MNWYDKSISKEAGLKEDIFSVLGALALFLSGMGVEHAAQKFHVSPKAVQEASQDAKMVEEAKKMKQAQPEPAQVLNAPKPSISPTQPSKQSKPKAFQPYKVDKKLVETIISLEYDPSRTYSSQGAGGLMQLMPKTWEAINKKYYGGKYPFDKYVENQMVNRAFGRTHLNEIKAHLDTHQAEWKADQLPLIIACYFGGQGTLAKANYDPKILKKKYPKTYDYMVRGSNLMGYSFF